MRPERIPLKRLLDASGKGILKRIAGAARRGAVFIYPTETVYGIGGVYDVKEVRRRILSAKKRSSDDPLILVAAERRHLRKIPVSFPAPAERLARAFWPGMLTLALPSPADPRGIAVRISPHPFIRALLARIGTPVYSTSANLSGEPYVNDPDAIFSLFSGTIDFMIDAGPLPPSKPSTIVKVPDHATVQIVREGAIPAHAIFEALGRDAGSFR